MFNKNKKHEELEKLKNETKLLRKTLEFYMRENEKLQDEVVDLREKLGEFED